MIRIAVIFVVAMYMALPAAREFAKTGIRVMTIAPGLFHTPMMEGLPPETVESIAANIPFPARLGDPAEFAQMALQITENPYLNGTTIRLARARPRAVVVGPGEPARAEGDGP